MGWNLRNFSRSASSDIKAKGTLSSIIFDPVFTEFQMSFSYIKSSCTKTVELLSGLTVYNGHDRSKESLKSCTLYRKVSISQVGDAIKTRQVCFAQILTFELIRHGTGRFVSANNESKLKGYREMSK